MPIKHSLHVMEYIVAIADAGSVSAAARALRVGQPTLSRQLAALERSVGAELFDRSAAGAAATPAGEAFVARARRALAEAAAIDDEVRLARDGMTGMLGIAFSASAINGPLAPVLQRLRKDLPLLDLQLHEVFDDLALTAGVRDGEYDIAVHRLPLRDPALRTTAWAREGMSVFLPEHHPVAVLDSPLPPDVLRGLPLVMWDRADSPRAFDEIMAIYQRIDATPHIAVTAHSGQSILALVSAGFGAAIMTDSYRNLRRAGVVVRSLSGLETTIYLTTRASRPGPHVERAAALMLDGNRRW